MATVTPISKPSAAELNTAVGRTDPVNTQSVCGRFVYYTTIDPRLPELALKVNKHALLILAVVFTCMTAGVGYFLVKHCLTLYKGLRATETTIQENYETLASEVAAGTVNQDVVTRILKTAELGMTASALRITESLNDTVVVAPANTLFGTLRGEAQSLARLLIASSLLSKKAFEQADAIIRDTTASDNRQLAMVASLSRQGKLDEAVAALEEIRDEGTKVWAGVSILNSHPSYVASFVAQISAFANRQPQVALNVLKEISDNSALHPELYVMPREVTLFTETAGTLDLKSALIFVVGQTFLAAGQYKIAGDYFVQIPNSDFKQCCLAELHRRQGNMAKAAEALSKITHSKLLETIISTYFIAQKPSHEALFALFVILTQEGKHHEAMRLASTLPEVLSDGSHPSVKGSNWFAQAVDWRLRNIAQTKIVDALITMGKFDEALDACKVFITVLKDAYLNHVAPATVAA